MKKIWNDNEDIRSLKSLILFGLRGMAAYAYHALILGYTNDEVNSFFYKGMSVIGEDLKIEELLSIAMETGKVNLKCMELLDKANTEVYGTPAPANVSLTISEGPFIVVSGHDLHDLYLLLEQTKGKGINIYTHGEMLLPMHIQSSRLIHILKATLVLHGIINRKNLIIYRVPYYLPPIVLCL